MPWLDCGTIGLFTALSRPNSSCKSLFLRPLHLHPTYHPPPSPEPNNNAITALQTAAGASLTPSRPFCSRAVAVLRFSASTKRQPHRSVGLFRKLQQKVSFVNVYTRLAAVIRNGYKQIIEQVILFSSKCSWSSLRRVFVCDFIGSVQW
jgi:hypothetical protein